MKFSGDPYRKNKVYVGVECTNRRVRERSVCVVLRENEKKRRTKNVWLAKKRKEIF